MANQNEVAILFEAREIAEKLNELLREDTMHRLRLHQKYSLEPDALTWTPDLHRRALMAETLYKKLDSIIGYKNIPVLKKAG